MKKSNWILLIFIILSFIPTIILYPKLPEQMPVHWNLAGEVDNYMDKHFGAFLLPGINLLVFVLFLVTPYIDPRKENYNRFTKTYSIFRWAFHIIFILITQFVLLYSIKGTDNLPAYLEISFAIPLMVSILFMIIGNYLGKVKHNYFFGIRTPWTLSSEEVWFKTHRLAGKLFVLSGLLGIIGSFFKPTITFAMLIIPIITSVIIVNIYSYLQFKKVK